MYLIQRDTSEDKADIIEASKKRLYIGEAGGSKITSFKERFQAIREMIGNGEIKYLPKALLFLINAFRDM